MQLFETFNEDGQASIEILFRESDRRNIRNIAALLPLFQSALLYAE